MDGLPFPFVVLDNREAMSGLIPNQQEVIAACPSEFRVDNEWSRAATQLAAGLSLTQFNTLGRTPTKYKTSEIIELEYRYLMTWLNTAQVPEDDRSAVAGWLLSLILVYPPKWE